MIKSSLAALSSNQYVQKLLEWNIKIAQYLIGVGSGYDVNHSGEECIFDLLDRDKKKPLTIFDVGANKGQFLDIAIRKLDYSEVNMHCFEPVKTSFEILEKRFSSHNYVTLNNIALGCKPGYSEIYYETKGSLGASLTRRDLRHIGQTMKQSEFVEIETLDNYCTTNFIDKIDLLKLDVEGHELDVLRGSELFFKQGVIQVVSFEFGGCNIDTRTFFRDYFWFFKEYNMSLYRITPGGSLYPIKFYTEFYEQFKTTNFVAINNKMLRQN